MKYRIEMISLAVALLCIPCVSHASELFFGASGQRVTLGEKFQAGLFVDTKAESVNAIEGDITFPSDSFSLQGFYTGGSLISFWVQQPHETKPGVVSFGGIIPGGFNGSKGYLFSLILLPKREGDSRISIRNERILLNDGQGTLAKTTVSPLNLTVIKTGGPAFTPLFDNIPPEPFKLSIAKDSEVLNGKWFLIFAAQDKGAGVDRYEILEEGQFGSFRSLFAKKNWITGESPYLLKDQSLVSDIVVKAFDGAGNVRQEILHAKHMVPLYENYFFWIIIIAICAIITFFRLWSASQKR